MQNIWLKTVSLAVLWVTLGGQISEAQTASSRSVIHVNQIGFLPDASKIAIVPNEDSGEFWLVHADTGTEMLRGPLSRAQAWDMAGQTVKVADFSAFDRPGKYRIRVKGLGDSPPFVIADEVYDPLLAAAIKAFYFNRASAPIEREYAGEFARPAGHPDTLVYVHPSAASTTRPAGTVVSSPKGWYDAGDYNKYVVNSGITTYTLLAALADFPALFRGLRLDIPESGNALPDLLDEILWNLEWLATMQDPHDGGVYHKLTTLQFSSGGMPHEQNQRRYLVQKSTAATLNFAAVMTKASRVLTAYETQLPGRAAHYRQLAENAWRWAEKHPKILYVQPADIGTGTYAMANEDLLDEWFWAAAELYALTGARPYQRRLDLPEKPRVPEWSYVETLGLFTLAQHDKTPARMRQGAQQLLVAMAEDMLREFWQSGYRVAMSQEDFRWGSNAVAMNKAMVLIIADRLSPKKEYALVARSLLDYVLGRNPTGYAFVTGFGSRSPQHIHHRVSRYHRAGKPVPGFLAGGPQPGWQDNCEYPSRLPALSYLDDWCSYSTNEVAINWNAPLVYVLAALRN